jgi:HlyD family secretion protein
MNRKQWIALASALAAILVVGYALGWFEAALPVDAARVRRAAIQQFVDEQAITRLPQTYLVATPSAARIEPIDVSEGSPVKKGQVVARLVPADLTLAVEEAQASVGRLEASVRQNADNSVEMTALEQTKEYVQSMKSTVDASVAQKEAAKAKEEYADKNLARIQRLFRSGAQTEDFLEQIALQQIQAHMEYQQDALINAALTSLQMATNLMPTLVERYVRHKLLNEAVLEKEKTEAEARLEMVRLNQQRGTIASPVDGVVLKRYVSNELHLDAGTSLLEIGRLEDLQVECDVLSLDVVDVKLGDRVEIYGPAIGLPRAGGVVQRIYPAGFTKVSSLGVEQQRVKVIVGFEPADLRRLLQERHLGVGYRVRVQIVTAGKPDAIVAPRSALFRAVDGAWQMFVIRGGRARLQTVQTGLMNDDGVEISSGVADGELVLIAPESSLVDGQRVQAIVREVAVPASTAAAN